MPNTEHINLSFWHCWCRLCVKRRADGERLEPISHRTCKSHVKDNGKDGVLDGERVVQWLKEDGWICQCSECIRVQHNTNVVAVLSDRRTKEHYNSDTLKNIVSAAAIKVSDIPLPVNCAPTQRWLHHLLFQQGTTGNGVFPVRVLEKRVMTEAGLLQALHAAMEAGQDDALMSEAEGSFDAMHYSNLAGGSSPSQHSWDDDAGGSGLQHPQLNSDGTCCTSSMHGGPFCS